MFLETERLATWSTPGSSSPDTLHLGDNNSNKWKCLHIGNHKHQSLRRRKGGTENSTNKSSVESSHGSSLRLQSRPLLTSHLHLNHLHTLSEYILASLNSPGIAMLSHRR